MQLIIERVRRMPKRVVFAEVEEEQGDPRRLFIRQSGALGEAILVGREDRVRSVAKATASIFRTRGSRFTTLAYRNAIRFTPNSSMSGCSGRANLFADCQRMINQDRNYFAPAMVARGDADAIVTGVTRKLLESPWRKSGA